MEKKIRYDGKIINVSDLPFTNEQFDLLYKDFTKGINLEVLAKKWKMGRTAMGTLLIWLSETKTKDNNRLDKVENVEIPKQFKQEIDERYPQYKWEDLSLSELIFYENYNKYKI